MIATTVVSSAMLEVIAEAYGVDYAETLTGFKWLAQHSIAREAAGGRFVMGFEEALGYSVGHVVRDKDGVSAALLFCDIAARCRHEGISVLDRLGDLYRRHGLFMSKQHAVKLPGEEGKLRIEKIMSELRENLPTVIGGTAVRRVRDLSSSRATDMESGSVEAIDLPASNVLAFDLRGGGRVLARPSGTEPKIKFYFEVRGDLGADESLAVGEERAMTRLEALESDFLKTLGI
jgi:phosphomannomutase